MIDNVVLGVMARAPLPGHCKTRLAATVGPVAAAALYRAMVRDTLNALANIQFAHRHIFATPDHDGVAILRALAGPSWSVQAQQGETFQNRLEHAMATLGANNCAPVLVGTDAPLLPVNEISASIPLLQRAGRVLMGPAEDGGYYLLGASNTDLELLRGISWSTDRVADQTRQRCIELGYTLEELPPTFDVDTAADLARLEHALAANADAAPRTAEALRQHMRD